MTAIANPFFEDWKTPLGTPPLGRIAPGHFVPAFEAAMREQLANVAAICADPAAPDFANTVAALERSGRAFERVQGVFENLNSSASGEALQEVERTMSPRFAAHRDAIRLNGALFARLDAVHAARRAAGLDAEQIRVVEEYHRDFVRSGARLDSALKAELKALNGELASLMTAFRLAVLADTAKLALVIDDPAGLAGLPQFAIDAAAGDAAAAGHAGKWAVTLQRPSADAFLTFSARRELREQVWRAWTKRGDNGDANDTNDLIRKIVAARQAKARLLGYDTYAALQLDGRMAKTPEAARGLLDRVWAPTRVRALQERDDLQAIVEAEGQNFRLAPWDWLYYAEKLRKARYDVDQASLKPFLQLDKLIEAQFATAHRLFGLTFTPRTDIETYAPEVRVWEVKDGPGRTVALFYGDYFARAGKQSGAWMSAFRTQERMDGAVVPLVLNNLNLPRPADGQPALLSHDDAKTLFHEFGHALHGMLSDVTYPYLSGTAVPLDFVEFPSQVYEKWLDQPALLNEFAVHYRTGETLDPRTIARLLEAGTFNQGFATAEFLASAFFDMDLHASSDVAEVDLHRLEDATRTAMGMPEEIALRHRPQHFLHLFGGDMYSAGYYAYLWSAVLDCDGFDAFREAGDPFDPATAKRLHDFVYAAGNTRDPSEAYRRFRGRDPEVEPLLRERGLAA